MLESIDIYIITFNRSEKLRNTLSNLYSSLFSKCRISVLDNCSTDETPSVCNSFIEKLPSLKIIRSSHNIGSAGNLIKAFMLSEKSYAWILCDDDNYDFSKLTDLSIAISEEIADIIHVGGHPYTEIQCRGQYLTPRNALLSNYQYFLTGSFLPSNIFKTKFLKNYLASAFDYAYFLYPHMPAIIAAHDDNRIIYITKYRLVTASIGTQSYDWKLQFSKWTSMSQQVENKNTRQALITDQYRGVYDASGIGRAFSLAIISKNYIFIAFMLKSFGYKCIINTFIFIVRKLKIFN